MHTDTRPMTPVPVPPTLGASSWLKVTCIGKRQETPDTFSYEFTPGDRALPPFRPGAHVNVRVPVDGETLVRTYTLSSSPKQRPHFSLTVKATADGRVSRWLANTLVPGMQVEVSLPEGDFVLPEQPAGRLLFISAGSGITPVMSMVRFLAQTANRSEIAFWHYARSPQDIIFHEELQALRASMPGLQLNFCVETASPDWNGAAGRIAPEHFASLKGLAAHQVYLCGPSVFMNAASDILKALGVPDHHIARELFALNLDQVQVASGVKVQFSSEMQASPATRKTLLDEALARGVPVTAGCRSGICKSCRCQKLSGETLNLLSGERCADPDVYILPCVTQALSDTVIAL